ncbi:M42 family metallopeptidase [Poriferisphaera sp. WC338]|uniref:M42 family metallopeptidase n=1 Tax=Poriferisphaera sp. WC338 TaxID=3425129 RepID=UPI003D818C0F
MDLQLLEQLTTTPGVAGREHRIRNFIADQTADLFDESFVDELGNLHGILRPKPKPSKSKKKKNTAAPKKIMIAAHMDQIGFMVRHVGDDGFLRLQNIGGFDPRNLFARVVTVHPDLNDPRKDLDGIMNPEGRPIHIATEDEKKKIPDVSEFIVDLGLAPAAVKKKIKIGDMVTLKAPVYQIGNLICSQCLDNRIASYIAIRALRNLKYHACEIHMVFTVQEEVGLRGAGPAVYQVQPDVAISLDTTVCCDLPGVPPKDRCTISGDGVGLNVLDSAAIVDFELLEEFDALAKQKKIKAQRTMLHRGGTDAGPLQRTAAGSRVMTILTPTRYIHTVTEAVHKNDVAAAEKLLIAYLERA